ncbi:MAG TPA: methionyl-tRNA formyltransferase [Steroidobacteraceae bacterium]|nr:methionyl-tRNA formyltransferase [Steroidobacteraceae bacterium]
MPLAVVYAGTPEFAVPALEAIVAAGHRVAAVYTQPDRPAGRGRALAASPVKRRALELGLALRQPATLADPAEIAALRALAPDVVAVAAYGLLLPPAALAVPRLGCLNIHASLLPRWRGAAPIQRALLAGDAETGVSIMRMEAGLDTGPVYATERLPIGPRDTAGELGARLAALGARALVETLAALEHGAPAAVPQPAEGVSYARKLDKREAPLDWTQPAAALERQVRAFVPWPVAETRWRGAPLRVHAALAVAGAAGAAPGTVVAADAAGLEVATGDGRLRLTQVQVAGRRVVAAAEFARGEARHGPLLGERLGGAP